MQKTSRFSRLLTLVTAVALAVCLPVSAYAETETTEEAAAPAVVEEAAQDNTADEAASEDSASCVRVVDVTIFMDTTKGHFESDPDNVALTYLNRAEFEETPITQPLNSQPSAHRYRKRGLGVQGLGRLGQRALCPGRRCY